MIAIVYRLKALTQTAGSGYAAREILLQQLTKKIEVNFIHSYNIHFNPQPTTVNVLNNLVQC